MSVVRWVFGGDWLGTRVALYVPGTYNVSQPLTKKNADRVVEETARFLSQLFGGATSQVASGYYVASDGTLIVETITIVYSYTKRLSRTQRQAVFERAELLKRELGQELVTVEINGKIRF